MHILIQLNSKCIYYVTVLQRCALLVIHIAVIVWIES